MLTLPESLFRLKGLLVPRPPHLSLVLSVLFFCQSSAQPPADVATLELGQAVERELSGGQRHTYQIALSEGQYVRVEIEPRGVSINVSIRPPDGQDTQVFDSLGRVQATIIQRVSAASGIHNLTVFARARATAGRYEIRLVELRPATEEERSLQQTRELMEEALRLHREGRYIEARPLLLRAIEQREKVLGPDSHFLAEPLERLAGNFHETGDYASAEPLYLRGLKILERERGVDHPAVANHLNVVGSLYEDKGDFSKAEEAYQRALSIFEKAQQTESHTGASVLGALGSIHYRQGDYQRAERYYQRSRAVWEKLLGPDHFHLEPIYSYLGHIAYDAGDYAKAKGMFERALALREKALGLEEAKIPVPLGDLAMLYSTMGDYAKAELLYLRALSIHLKGGMSDPHVPTTLYGLARLSEARGRVSEAVKFQSQASEIEERHLELNLAIGSERERLAFLANHSLRASRNISLHTSLAQNDASARELAVTTILRRKGRVQDALADSLAALRRRSGVEEQGLFDELSKTTSQLARLIINGPQRTTLAEHQTKIKAAEEQRERLEADISRRSSGFYERSKTTSLSDVQAAIGPDAALIEFAVYRPFDPKVDNKKAYGEPRYVAYVIRRQGEVRWVELGAAKVIDGAIETLRQAVRDPQRKDVPRLARAVDKNLMQPVRALVGDAGHLLISPDGELNLIPFETLVDEKGRHLIENYSITYLTTGRDLVRMHVARGSKSQPAIVANPVFGDHSSEPLLESASGVKTTRISTRRSITNTRNLSDTYFAPLSGTAREATSIKTLFPEATLLTGASATETAVKGLAAPKVFHIATHGFFLSEDNSSRDKDVDTSRATIPTTKIGNPLLRSGLALAGANRRGGSTDDGILTALEASGLNLWGTKLVVLSACDTGLGEIRNGEGVYGLRRAFVIAGAESVVMSLWPVSDFVTRELMVSYYKNLKLGMGRGESLRRAKLEMLRRPGRSHPFYWASFIQSGEWATLDGKR